MLCRKYLFVFCLFIFLPVIGATGQASNSFSSDDISNICCLKYHSGDLSSFAHINLDDSNWYQLPGDTPAGPVLFDISKGIGCFRLYVFMDNSHPYKPMGVTVPPMGSAYEIFFNGHKIGARGVVKDCFVEAPVISALFRLPFELIKPRAMNLIALRVMETTSNQIQLNDTFQIGSHESLLIQVLKQNYRLGIIEWIFMTFLSIFLIASFFLSFGDRSNGEYIAFTCLVFIYLVIYVLESHVFYESGFKNFFIQKIIFLFSILMAITGLVFLLCAYNEPIRLWIKVLLIFYGMYGAVLMIPLPFSVFRSLLMNGGSLMFGCTTLAGLYLAIKAVYQKRHESIPVLVGIAGLGVGIGLNIANQGNIYRISRFLYVDFGAIFFLLTVACAFMFRYNRILREVRLFSGKLLTAHEAERKRLSRDLHDGLGQTLLAFKLRLQIMGTSLNFQSCEHADQFNLLISEASDAIKELRQISLNLRPAFIEDTPFVRLLEYHAMLFSKKTGIAVQVTGDYALDPCVEIKDNLYRICQEALTNIKKHTRADLVCIDLQLVDKQMVMSVTDNGKNFSLNANLRKSTGVGISSMKERAHLLGGRFDVQATPTFGCKILIKVPFK